MSSRYSLILICCTLGFLGAGAGCVDRKRDSASGAADANASAQPSGKVVSLVRQMESGRGPKVTWDAYHQLSAMGAQALPSLLQLCKSNDPTLRRGAARGFAALKAPVSRVLPALLQLATDQDTEVRFAALHALPKLQGELKPAGRLLRGLLRDPAQKVREAAAAVAIKRFPSASVGWLRRALANKQAGVRATAVQALGKLGKPALPLLNRIIASTRDADEEVRYEACRALTRFGPPAAAAVPALEQVLLKDSKAAVRLSAARALGTVATTETSAALTLSKALGDKDKRIRDVSAGALANMGAGAAPALPALLKSINDPSHHTRGPSAVALGAIGDSKAIPLLVKRLTDSRFHVVLESAEALGQIGLKDPNAVKALRRALKHKSSQAREAATAGVVKLGPDKGRWALGTLQRLAKKDPALAVRERADKALRALKP
jgi:HEAT repeat protein